MTWEAHLKGQSGLIQVPTGSGKTFAAVMGPIAKMLSDKRDRKGIQLLYLTPLRALSRDLALAIREPIESMNWPLHVGIRNGDSKTSERTKQLKTPPEILVTTPESLTLLLSNPKAEELFKNLDTVILDEWHELMGSKRGSQTELCLSWLRQQRQDLQTWAISATIGNLNQAARSCPRHEKASLDDWWSTNKNHGDPQHFSRDNRWFSLGRSPRPPNV